MKFEDVAARWLTEYKRTVAETTYYKAQEALRVHLLPYYGGREIDQIARNEIIAYVDYKAENGSAHYHNGIARRSVKMHITVLRKIFDYAIGAGLVAETPVKEIPLRGVPERSREINVFTADEVSRLIGAARPKWFADVILLAYRTGMRRGEIYGLKWDDVSFEERTLRVRRSVAALVHGQRIVKETKTRSSNRVIALDAATVDMLMRRRAACGGCEWVIYNQYFAPPSPWYTSKFMRAACLAIGIPPRGLHTLRHTHATMLLRAGVYVKIVQERLGHSDITTTLQIYAHAIPSMQADAVKVMDRL